MDGWLDEWINGWMEGWTDGRTDGGILFWPLSPALQLVKELCWTSAVLREAPSDRRHKAETATRRRTSRTTWSLEEASATVAKCSVEFRDQDWNSADTPKLITCPTTRGTHFLSALNPCHL